jgi:hypothetical protein
MLSDAWLSEERKENAGGHDDPEKGGFVLKGAVATASTDFSLGCVSLIASSSDFSSWVGCL